MQASEHTCRHTYTHSIQAEGTLQAKGLLALLLPLYFLLLNVFIAACRAISNPPISGDCTLHSYQAAAASTSCRELVKPSVVPSASASGAAAASAGSSGSALALAADFLVVLVALGTRLLRASVEEMRGYPAACSACNHHPTHFSILLSMHNWTGSHAVGADHWDKAAVDLQCQSKLF